MKYLQKLYVGLILLASFITITACEDFLEVAPETQINTSQFYQTADDFEIALNGAYSTLTQGYYGSDFFAFGEIRSDNAFTEDYSRVVALFGTFELDATSSIIAGFWQNSYRGVQSANAIIARIEEVNMSEDQQNRISGEAHFIRALLYFNLVQIFGPIPSITEPISGSNVNDTYDEGRASVDAVYQTIISDLEAAESLLAEFPIPNEGRATVGSAKALLGKVYLTLGDYPSARDKLQEVVDLGAYGLLDDYEELYPPLVQENNRESIFEVQHLAGAEGANGSLANLFAPRGSGNAIVMFTGGEGGDLIPTADLIDSYQEGDSREEASIGYWTNPTGVTLAYPKKYLAQPFAELNDGANVYVIRYADVLLMLAEALNEVGYAADGQAFEYLNQVRNRAGLPALNSSDLSDQQAFQEHILDERRWEFAFEFQRWFDLKRTGTAIETINAYEPLLNIGQNDLLFPLPAAQVANNPDVLTQNPGY